ncbi:sensor histidine kinase [Clostridium neuense]|uniref:histidine kinase n=1 Tax=Clostridium neuense TaxID=1728934 RepID=A0ABW8TMB3_9CLOT
MKKLIKKFKNFKIGTKIVVCYLILSVLSISFSTFIYYEINKRIMTRKVSEMALQTLQTIDSSLDVLMYTVNNESKIILSNQGLQNVLRSGYNGFNYDSQIATNRYLTEFIQSNMFISSVYIFDNYGNRYFVDKKSYKSFNLEDIKQTKWYDEIFKAKGGAIIKLNAGGLFNEPDENYVSIMRVINDLDTQKPIGTMIVNIPEEAIVNSFNNITRQGSTNILLRDENNNNIIHYNNLSEYCIEDKVQGSHYYYIKKVKGNDYIISYLKNNLSWKVISIVPFKELSNQSNIYKTIILNMLILNGIMCLLGLILISYSITKPIDKLIKSMIGVENGEFKKVSVSTGNDEIGKLKDVYNTMICRIENLIEQIVKEQKIKRKAELDVLQSQIKPHFLYNSFDAISCLALDGRNNEVYEIIKALGNFYRTSLSNGREVIYIREELQTVKSYLTIQQIRYDNMFSVHMDIDKRANEYKILRLVLQPLIENAIYHGIKPTRRGGNIFVRTLLKKDCIELVVEDDGVGMSTDTLINIQEHNAGGIGLHGTMERLNIFYNSKSNFQVESKLGKGTKVTICIPIGEEGNDGK